MAWIREEKLHWANVINVMSINPAAMKAVNDMNNAVTFSGRRRSRARRKRLSPRQFRCRTNAASERWRTESFSDTHPTTLSWQAM